MFSIRKLSKSFFNLKNNCKSLGLFQSNKYFIFSQENDHVNTKINETVEKINLSDFAEPKNFKKIEISSREDRNFRKQNLDKQSMNPSNIAEPKNFKKIEISSREDRNFRKQILDKQSMNVDNGDISILLFSKNAKNPNINAVKNKDKFNIKEIKTISKFEEEEFIYLSNFNENIFKNEGDLKNILDEKAFEIQLTSKTKREFETFCKKFPLFSMIILGNNLTKMNENNLFFSNEIKDTLKDYLYYLKIIFIKLRYLKNQDFYTKISFKVIDDLIKTLNLINKVELDNKSNSDNQSVVNSIIIDFIIEIKNIEEIEKLTLFYFFYALIENFSDIKKILITDDKEQYSIDFNECNPYDTDPHREVQDTFHKQLIVRHAWIKKYRDRSDEILINTQSMYKTSNLKDYLINNFPDVFIKLYKKDEFMSNLSLTKYLYNIIILYEFEYLEDKRNIDIKLSLFLNLLDEIIGNHILIGNNDILIMNLVNSISFFRMYAKDDMRVFFNIYCSLAKRFMKIEDFFSEEKQKLIFVYFLFIKFIYKSSFTMNNLTNLINANFFYLDFKISTEPEKLEKASDWLICHLLMVCGYCSFNVHENLYLEVKKRIPKILQNFNSNVITYLITGIVLNGKKDENLFYEVLTRFQYTKSLKKNFLNIGFYIALSLYDNTDAWKIYLKNLEFIFYTNINDYDCRQCIEMTMNLLITPGFKKNKEMYYVIKELNKKVMLLSGLNNPTNIKSKWFFRVSLSHGIFEKLFIRFLENRKIKFEYQKKLLTLFDVDFLIGKNVVIYLNGPVHYLVNEQGKLNLKSISKTRLLEDHGFYVINVRLEHFIVENHNSGWENNIIDYIESQIPSEVFEKNFINSY